VPASWDGRSFADAFRAGRAQGRDHLVLTTGAWTCQRAVRFEDHLCIRTAHDGYHDFQDVMLFDLADDPHEQRDLAAAEPARVRHALTLLDRWQAEVVAGGGAGVDPLETVLREGGPYHVRGQLPAYLARLRATGRASCAERLSRRHAAELA
jgi:hypothetical protein